MNKYKELKDKQEKELNAFPMFFAFNKQQFNEGMERLGLRPEQTTEILKLRNTGGYIRKSDDANFSSMWSRFNKEHSEAISADETGDGFIFDMFFYELENHEFIITWEIADTLDALCLSLEEVTDKPNLRNGLNKAIRAVRKNYNDNN